MEIRWLMHYIIEILCKDTDKLNTLLMLYKINNHTIFYKVMVWSVTINVFLFLILHSIFEKWTFFMSNFKISI